MEKERGIGAYVCVRMHECVCLSMHICMNVSGIQSGGGQVDFHITHACMYMVVCAGMNEKSL